MVATAKPPPEYEVGPITDKDIAWVVSRLLKAPWGHWLSPERIAEACARSMCFGLFRVGDRKLVGFARVVSDGVTFSSVMDFYIEEGYRGQGLGTLLMQHVVSHPAVCRTVSILSARTALDPAKVTRFYRKFGYIGTPAMMRDPDK